MFWSLTATSLLAASVVYGAPAKDQSRLPSEAPQTGDNDQSRDEDAEPKLDSVLPGDIPDVRRVELTEDSAKKSIDAFVVVRDKYSDKGIERFDTLEEFAQKAPAGKNLITDLKAFGFKSISQWNDTIMNVGFAYSAIAENSVPDIKQQIEDVRSDKALEQPVRDKMISSLETFIPSDNNRKIIEKLMTDPAYKDKLMLLSEQE